MDGLVVVLFVLHDGHDDDVDIGLLFVRVCGCRCGRCWSVVVVLLCICILRSNNCLDEKLHPEIIISCFYYFNVFIITWEV